MVRRAKRFGGFLFLFLMAARPSSAQTSTYHLHKEASSTSGFDQLKTAGPDAASIALQTANLKGVGTGSKLIKQFDTQSGVPNASGVIPSGSSLTFALWMKKTANFGTMFPQATVKLNNTSGTALCTATGSAALTTTLTQYTLTCTTTANISMATTDRFYLWAGVSLTVGSSGGTFAGEIDIEGTLNGNYDSQIVLPLPTGAPTISSLTPNGGAVGSSIVIAGTNFRSSQVSSTVKFNGTTSTPTVWGSTSITAPVPSGATTGPVVVTVGGQASAGVTFTVTPAPSITGLSPNAAAPGASITISGTNFGAPQGNGNVTFNGTTATIASWASSSITATVPSGATSGNVIVTAPGGVVSSGVNFTVLPTPTITSLSSTSGAVGASITITGTNFGSSQGSSTVKFNGTAATPTSWGATSIGVPVPTGATSGNVVVHASGVDTNGVNFTVVPPPSITSLSATSGAVGAPITITGMNFGSSQGSGTVTFNGTTATPTSWNATTIAVPVPNGATTGNVVVNASGVASNGVAFTVAPTVGSLSPSQGPIGTPVTINGSNFGSTQGTSTVTFNGVTAAPTFWRADRIVAPVPSGTTNGPVVVTVGGVVSNGVTFTVAPAITAVTPPAAPVGATVTVAGPRFGYPQGTSTITFNGVTATPTTWALTTIAVPVPVGATSGPVVVTIGGVPSNGVNFTVGPGISSVSPTSGGVGTSVTISGSGFGSTQGTSTVTFNGVAAVPSSWGASSIAVPVPPGATTGQVVVTVGGVSSNGASFTVPPAISGISPSSGPIGTTVTVTGSNFGATQQGAISFGGTAALATSWGSSKIVVPVPTGAVTGPVTVNVGTMVSNGVTFTVGTGSVTGTVTRASDGTAINGALVEALQSNVSQASTTTATNGTYTISNLIAGTYDIRVSAAGFGTAILSGNSVAVGAPTVVNASLGSSGTISGKITQADGITAISGATVNALQGTDTAGTATTNSTGNYTIATLAAGSYSVQASSTGFKAQTQTGVSVTVGNTTTINLSLPGQSLITYDYDELGRLVGTVDSQGDAVAYNYDPVGNLLSISRNHSNQASIIYFTPQSGPVGTTVTIYGTAFSPTAGQNTVKFNGTSATVSSSTSTQIVVPVPTGATTGTISVTAPSGSATSSSTFNVTTGPVIGRPTITSFNPTMGIAGASVTVTGTNFDPNIANDRLKLNTSFMPVASATATTLTSTVPTATASGRFTLSTGLGTTQSSQDFFIPFGTHVAGDIGYTGRTSLGGNQAITLGSANKIGLLLFDATAGQSLTVEMSGSTFSSCTLNVISPATTVLSSGSCTSSTTFLSSTVLPVTGTYTLGLDPSGSTGTVNLALVSDPVVPITPGGSPVTVTTTVAGQDARLTFQGTANQRVSLLVTNVTNPAALVNLLDPNGNAITYFGIATGGPYFMDTQTLATAGTYTVQVQHNSTNVGSETLQLYNVPPDVTATATLGGAPVSIATAVPGQNASLTFSGTAGQKVSITLTNGTYNGIFNVKVKNPDGSTLTSSGFLGATNFLDSAALGTTGTYTVFVDPQGTTTGGVTLQLNNASDVTGTITPGGSAVPVTTTVAGQDVRLTFTGAVNQRVSLLVTNVTNPAALVNLLDPNGNAINYFGIATGGPYFMDTQTLALAGTYTVQVQHNSTNVGSETLQLYDVPADATASVTIGGSSAPVATTVPGQNASVTFSGTSGQNVTINLTSGTYSSCNLKLKNPDGSLLTSGSCSGATNTIGPTTLGATGTFTIFIDPQGTATGGVTVQVTGQ